MIAFIALMRIIPYLLTAAYAWRTGHKWLSVTAIYVFAMAIVGFMFPLPRDVSGLVSFGAAVLLLMHALELRRKAKE